MSSNAEEQSEKLAKDPCLVRSARTWLRSWTPDDLPLAFLLWGDPEVTRFIDARGRLTESEVRGRLSTELANGDAYGVQYWPVFLLQGNAFIGCCGLRPYRPEKHVFELGVHLRPSYWGSGYASEVADAVIEYAFTRLAAHALFAGHNPNNEKSRRLLMKLGFAYTGDEYYAATGLMHPSYLLTRPVREDPDHQKRKAHSGS